VKGIRVPDRAPLDFGFAACRMMLFVLCTILLFSIHTPVDPIGCCSCELRTSYRVVFCSGELCLVPPFIRFTDSRDGAQRVMRFKGYLLVSDLRTSSVNPGDRGQWCLSKAFPVYPTHLNT